MERKNERAKNTYILALDGDIDFSPPSIIKLVDMMKKNNKVACYIDNKFLRLKIDGRVILFKIVLGAVVRL